MFILEKIIYFSIIFQFFALYFTFKISIITVNENFVFTVAKPKYGHRPLSIDAEYMGNAYSKEIIEFAKKVNEQGKNLKLVFLFSLLSFICVLLRELL